MDTAAKKENGIACLFKKVRGAVGGKWLLAVAGIVGIALLLLGACGGTSGGTADTVADTGESEVYRRTLENEIADLCRSVRGAGEVKVCLTLETGQSYAYSGSHMTASDPPRVLGVAVVCEGGGSDTVRGEITYLICALCHIGANRVHVSRMK